MRTIGEASEFFADELIVPRKRVSFVGRELRGAGVYRATPSGRGNWGGAVIGASGAIKLLLALLGTDSASHAPEGVRVLWDLPFTGLFTPPIGGVMPMNPGVPLPADADF